ncbi:MULTISPECIES: DUF169 domain-containing protein [unclassified Pseudodesulfovibrio]|uniref:DUF169 domain-containing protein n=1 Tax=unclassified Pseudodesulfovibrio TaxID=2661612 RepID=UPI000FEBF5C2|nr:MULTISPECIES: DUF169 domain-containing protein [unclassified Pseudodesulfovibrio]MCJ2164208.1 DUF169 domain-containing protein [Pseudodesulfovibrio sp. S3-i]RWU05168.1 hypothetical protein DWB63_05800 [Pseudodesulfovibrio sp. S3]
MDSLILKHLVPEFAPVAIVWSDTVPADAFQFKEGRFGCVLYLFAEASRRGKTAAGCRENIQCPGGRAALGLGIGFDASEAILDQHAALFSKGLCSARNQEAYEKIMANSPRNWQEMYAFGERRHASGDLAREWILHGLPRYDIPNKYVLFKPLSRAEAGENIRAVIFPVNPVELSGLVTLAGSVMSGTDPVQVPQGTDCTSIAAFPYAQAESPEPRAVLGMMGLDGREMMRKRFRDDVLTLTVPMPLFERMEAEAADSVFQLSSWEKLRGQ